jgi:hypothetical protein
VLRISKPEVVLPLRLSRDAISEAARLNSPAIQARLSDVRAGVVMARGP